MLLIGLTGGIGAGKSTVSAGLAERGAAVIDADAIVRELQEPGTVVFQEMVQRFGPGIVAADGTLDRAAVAELVFTDAAALADLGAIVHPRVHAEIERRLSELAGTDRVVILDVPLLVESGRSDMVGTIVVDLHPDEAVRRLVEHRGFDAEDARNRIARQVSREDRLAKADHVIDNHGLPHELESQLDGTWEWIQSLRDAGAGGAAGAAPGAAPGAADAPEVAAADPSSGTADG